MSSRSGRPRPLGRGKQPGLTSTRPGRRAPGIDGGWLALLFLALPLHLATAQIVGDPPTATYLGSRPVKTPGGADVAWNGTAFAVRPGGAIDWTISVVHDDPAGSTALVTIDDYVPAPADFPVLPFSFPGDVLSAPAGGVLSYDQGWVHDRNVSVPFGSRIDLVLRTRVSGSAPAGSAICNMALVSYLVPPPPPGLALSTYAYTITPQGEDDQTCVIVSGDPNLAGSTKVGVDQDGDGVLRAGERVDFAISVLNSGSSDALDVEVTDDLSPGLTLLGAGQGATLSGARVTWNRSTTPALARVRPGESVSLSVWAVAGCTSDAGMICNQAFLAAAGLAPVGSDDPSDADYSSATCLPTAGARLAGSSLTVVDASGGGVFSPGEAVSFLLDVTNSGSDVARDVTVTLPVPAGLVGIAPRAGGMLAGGEIRWDPSLDARLAAITPGASVALGFDALVDPDAAHGSRGCTLATLARSGCPTESSDDPAMAGGADPTCFTVTADPVLALSTTIAGVAANPGDVVDLEAILEWVAGADAAGVEVSLDVAGLPLLGNLTAGDGGIVTGGRITWTAAGNAALASVGPGDSVTLRASAVVLCGAPDGAQACASGLATAVNMASPALSDDASLPGAADPSCAFVTAPILAASLTIADAGGDGLLEPLEGLLGSVRLANTGSAAARDVVLLLPLPAVDLDPLPSDGGRLVPGAIEWDSASTPQLLTLDPGAAITLTFTARLDLSAAGLRLCHQAELSSRETAGCPAILSDDPGPGGTADPTCTDVVGDDLPPGEVPDGDPAGAGAIPVTLRRAGTDLVLSWAPAPRARTHFVYRGEIASFQDRPWNNPAEFIDDPEDAVPSCDLADLTFTDTGAGATASGSHYYLVGGRNLAGDGPLGASRSSTGATERPSAAVPCP